jgi:hypothetical protein
VKREQDPERVDQEGTRTPEAVFGSGSGSRPQTGRAIAPDPGLDVQLHHFQHVFWVPSAQSLIFIQLHHSCSHESVSPRAQYEAGLEQNDIPTWLHNYSNVAKLTLRFQQLKNPNNIQQQTLWQLNLSNTSVHNNESLLLLCSVSLMTNIRSPSNVSNASDLTTVLALLLKSYLRCPCFSICLVAFACPRPCKPPPQ